MCWWRLVEECTTRTTRQSVKAGEYAARSPDLSGVITPREIGLNL